MLFNVQSLEVQHLKEVFICKVHVIASFLIVLHGEAGTGAVSNVE